MVNLIKWSEEVSNANSWAFAYLTAPTATTATLANTYYPISWSFTNLLKNFTLVATPAIKYNNGNGIWFQINYSSSVSTAHPSSTLRLGIKKNWVLEIGSVMAMFCRNAWELYNVSWTCVVNLQNKDEIQLVIASEFAWEVITIWNYITTINEFFDKL